MNWIVFAELLTYEGRKALFPAGTTARGSSHRMLQAGFEPAQNLNSSLKLYNSKKKKSGI